MVFTTEWCGDCKMAKPILRDLQKEFANDPISFVEVDAQEAALFGRENSGSWKVLKVPAFYLVKDGHAHLLGYEYLPFEKLKQAISLVVPRGKT